MYSLNDPMLNLILRFVGHDPKTTLDNDQFLKKELADIQTYLKDFPTEEREARAMEWIQKYAKAYRSAWERRVVDADFVNHRCADCPLTEPGQRGHCKIHDRWLEFLNKFLNEELSSKEYVEQSLNLLAQHKNELKVKKMDFVK